MPNKNNDRTISLGGMQPYFFPYLGQFALLDLVDVWIILDTAQYIRHGWVNRNRIIHPQKGWQYITVPTQRTHYSTPINQIRIANNKWKTSLKAKLSIYKKTAPHYYFVNNIVQQVIDFPSDNLAELNSFAFKTCADVLGITTTMVTFSTCQFQAETEGHDEFAIAVCRAFGAGTYVNSPGGRAIYDPDKFAIEGLRFHFQIHEPLKYDCGKFQYIPDLSILDTLMWNDIETVKQHLKKMKAHNYVQ